MACVAAACSSTGRTVGGDTPEPGEPGAGAGLPYDASATGDASSSEDAGGAGGACSLDRIPLLLGRAVDGTVNRLHVAISYQNKPAVLLVDTGSALTFLQEPLGSPDPVPDAGTIQIGCETVNLIGRPESSDPAVGGLPSVGTLGCDMFRRGPSKIDLVKKEIVFHQANILDETASWPRAPMDVVRGEFAAHVVLDGSPVRLLLDTGASDVLWFGQAAQPGDIEVEANDAVGDTIKMYYGTVVLTVGSWHGTVPVLRVPSWPYFEKTITGLGGNLQGLIGDSALGSGVVIDRDAQELRLGQSVDGG